MKHDISIESIKGNPRVCVHCPTLKEATQVLQIFNDSGMKWSSGSSFLDYNYYDNNFTDTVYYLDGTYGSKLRAAEKGMEIIKASDFIEYNTKKEKEDMQTKKFKNNFGITSTNTHLLKAFAEEAKQAGWKYDEYSSPEGKTTMFFNANLTNGSLKPQSFWYANSVDSYKTFNLPSQWNEAIEYMKEQEEVQYKLGDIFIGKDFNEKYLLACTNDDKGNRFVSLISLTDGNRWTTQQPMPNSIIVSQELFAACANNEPEKFVKQPK